MNSKIKKGLGRGLSSLIGETKVEKNTNKLNLSEIVPNQFQPRKNFEVDNQDYELSLNKSSDNKISVEINSPSRDLNSISETVEIIPISQNKYKLVTNHRFKQFLDDEGDIFCIPSKYGNYMVDGFYSVKFIKND